MARQVPKPQSFPLGLLNFSMPCIPISHYARFFGSMQDMSKLITPAKLPLNHQRIIANKFISELRRGNAWKVHERIYGDLPDFKIVGAHTNPNPGRNKDVVEKWLPFIIHADDRIGLPTYAAIISETTYNKARDYLSKNGLIHSLDYILKVRNSNLFRVDRDKQRYRVRRAITTQDLSESQEEAILTLVNYLALKDVAEDLVADFYDDIAFRESYANLIAIAERINRNNNE